MRTPLRELQTAVSAHQSTIHSSSTYLCSSRALDILKLDTTSPVTRMKSERTRDLASTSRSTSPRERYRSEVTKRTVLEDVCWHHLDFLQEGKKTSGRHKEAVPTNTLGHSVPSACHTGKGMQGASCDSEPAIARLKYTQKVNWGAVPQHSTVLTHCTTSPLHSRNSLFWDMLGNHCWKGVPYSFDKNQRGFWGFVE